MEDAVERDNRSTPIICIAGYQRWGELQVRHHQMTAWVWLQGQDRLVGMVNLQLVTPDAGMLAWCRVVDSLPHFVHAMGL